MAEGLSDQRQRIGLTPSAVSAAKAVVWGVPGLTWVRTVSGLTTSLVGRGRRRSRAEADGAEHHPELVESSKLIVHLLDLGN
jgi:hypothetical protein